MYQLEEGGRRRINDNRKRIKEKIIFTLFMRGQFSFEVMNDKGKKLEHK